MRLPISVLVPDYEHCPCPQGPGFLYAGKGMVRFAFMQDRAPLRSIRMLICPDRFSMNCSITPCIMSCSRSRAGTGCPCLQPFHLVVCGILRRDDDYPGWAVLSADFPQDVYPVSARKHQVEHYAVVAVQVHLHYGFAVARSESMSFTPTFEKMAVSAGRTISNSGSPAMNPPITATARGCCICSPSCTEPI